MSTTRDDLALVVWGVEAAGASSRALDAIVDALDVQGFRRINVEEAVEGGARFVYEQQCKMIGRQYDANPAIQGYSFPTYDELPDATEDGWLGKIDLREHVLPMVLAVLGDQP